MSKGLKKWKLFESKKRSDLDLPFWFLNILEKRGLTSKKNVTNYLQPKYESLTPFDNFLGTKEAAERISKAVKEEEKIVIYGDYDVDGLTATTLIYELLSKIGALNFETYIPHRESEGYGLNKGAIDGFIKSEVDLVITVDCGITSKGLIDEAKNIDFIVVDHHQIDFDKLPQKSINIHPSLTKDKREYSLSGCGIAFYLAKAVQQRFMNEFPPGQEKWLLDLVALATICDIVPLIGENRTLATWGLKVLSKTKRVGLLALAKSASINLEEVTSYEVGFSLGPRLNAAGRIEHAKLALELLTTKDGHRAQMIAKELSELNTERQKMCERIITEAREELKNSNQKEHKIFLLSNKNWPRGVVGIVASRISDEHHKPVIVFENDGQNHHGSARSIDGFDIVEALGSCNECLEKFGGHAKAAGLTVKDEKFVIFSDRIVFLANEKIKEEDLVKTIEIDTKINSVEINDKALDLIAKMEPTGFGNQKPVFLIEGVTVEDVNRVGKGREHLKFKIQQIKTKNQQSKEIGGISFNEERELEEAGKYDMVGTLKYNIWNNRKSIEFRMIDFRKSD